VLPVLQRDRAFASPAVTDARAKAADGHEGIFAPA